MFLIVFHFDFLWEVLNAQFALLKIHNKAVRVITVACAGMDASVYVAMLVGCDWLPDI